MKYIQQQQNIKFIRDKFEDILAEKNNLTRVSAPIFLEKKSGLNDNLNGVETPVGFQIKDGKIDCEINHSLAKWKRVALKKYDFKTYCGLYTNMNAIRKDEVLDEIHSVYVDQWDWEAIIEEKDRNLEVLMNYAKKVYKSVLKIRDELEKEKNVSNLRHLPNELTFIKSQDLEDMYPNISAQERENLIAKKHNAVFLIGIGHKLKSGHKHDGRSPDYDDWNLNGDLIVWNEKIGRAFEISSMGIRVDAKSLSEQLAISGALDRLEFEYHDSIMKGQLPFTIGGGIGQSRLCMLLLGSMHIGEVQASVWPEKIKKNMEDKGIKLL